MTPELNLLSVRTSHHTSGAAAKSAKWPLAYGIVFYVPIPKLTSRDIPKVLQGALANNIRINEKNLIILSP